MPRSLLTLLLLLHYLLVACASVAGRANPVLARPFAYVHHHDCQLRNAWRGGVCFEDCNGVQYQVHKGHKAMPLHQLLASLKGIDLHCLPTVAAVAARPALGRAGRLPARGGARVPSGVRGQIYWPPRRG